MHSSSSFPILRFLAERPSSRLRLQLLARQQCRLASVKSPSPAAYKPPPRPQRDEDEETHTPKPLSKPIGQTIHPLPGDNDGIDHRDWRQRRDDFFDYDKHLERRRQLTQAVSKPYFREWTNMKYQKGKTFLANPKIFRADKSLYFPNLRGVTLASPKDEQDTTVVLRDRISVVRLFSGRWAEQQTATFVDGNDGLKSAMAVNEEIAQSVQINVEENTMRAALIKLFMPGLRKQLAPKDHGKYFLIRRGFSEEIRQVIAMANSKVGYIYLLDTQCRIRWAGSGEAEAGEQDRLGRALHRLLLEYKDPGQSVAGAVKPMETPQAAVQ
ncbi:Mitochondrial ATPase complex subunit atp10 [Agyrium rufum]|nr:Mitochondrial ATPase complex subunit atp10 [Agyrium rufum]